MGSPLAAMVRRVPADLVLHTLRQSGTDLKPASLRNWARRGHISRTDDGYDLTEVLRYVERPAPTERGPSGRYRSRVST